MIAAIYARKSVESNKGESIDTQIQLCKNYYTNTRPINSDLEFVYYIDEGFSGGNANRPKFKELLNDIKNKKFSALICYRLDRISRNVADFSSTLQLLQENHVEFISIKENFDTSTPIGRAMVHIASVFAQLERETIAERIKDNMLELAKTGRWLGGTVPLGFKSEVINYMGSNNKEKKMYKLVEVPEELETVKLIFDLYLEKKGFPSVANYLCSNHYKGKNGGEFSRTTVEQIIQNPVYTFADKKIYDYFQKKGSILCGNFNGEFGVMTYNKREKGKKERPIDQWIIAVALHQGIIPSSTWLKCQSITNQNTNKVSPRSSTGNKFLLSGLLVCGECGSGMSSWSRNNPVSNRYERYYRCNLKNRAANRCSSKMLNADVAEDLILSTFKNISVENIIESFDKFVNNKNTLDNLSKDKQNIESQICTNQKMIQSLIRKLALLEEDPMIIKEFQNEIKRLQDEISTLNSQLHSMEDAQYEQESTAELISSISSKLDSLKPLFDSTDDISFKRSLLLELIDFIVWDSKNKTLQVNLFNSNTNAPIGGVRKRKNNLSFGDVSRQNHATSYKRKR